jgi:two-component system, cell cycle sensor histidine kinase and response regulator CckA
MSSVPKILVVDEEPRMCDSLQILLSDQSYEVFTANAGRQAIDCLSENCFDVVLMDMVMPDMNGCELMDHIKSRWQNTFVIVITGHASLDSAVNALRKGAYDYLRKPFEYDELLKTIQNALYQKKLASENEILNGKLVMTETRYQYLVHNSPDIIYTLDEQGNFMSVNSAVERLIGYNADELIGKHYSTIIDDGDMEKARWYFNKTRTAGHTGSGIEIRLKICGNGHSDQTCEPRYLTAELKSTGMYDMSATMNKNRYIGTYGVARDVSPRLQLESQLQQFQKMEALGTLAGGIAHDFNNLLMGIEGNTALMLLEMETDHPYFQKLKNIEQCVKNGADLTRQLLGFARGGKYQVKPTDLNELLRKSSDMFGRTKKEIKIHSKYRERLWAVAADPGQMEQVLLNLYINAWQAMPEGGELYLQSENVILDDVFVKPHGVKPGKYVKVSMTDTGVGMDKATLARIFDPFFTTKEMGRGTGLGLASAYGIVKNHGGIITAHSEKGSGAVFSIYLPATTEKVKKEENDVDKNILRGDETILFVDDENIIVEVGTQIMESLGYAVITATSGQEALNIFRRNQNEIDMIILDMIMPEMTGKETYGQLKALDPEIKILLSSGYSLDNQTEEILKRGRDSFIQKPFNIKGLSHKLREILEK